MAGWDANLIVDAGAHQGEDTEFYLRKGFRVVAVEASPRLASGIEQRFAAEIASGQLVVVQAAITERNGRVNFFENTRTSVWGTTRPEWAERNSRVGAPSRCIEVEGVTFETLLHRFGVPYFLKVDIEGSDMLCLEALRGFAAKPRYVSFESTKSSWKELLAEFDLLRSLGYHRYKVVPQHTVEAQVPPSPAREGHFVEHRFPAGASGQFGAEAPGEWVDRTRALAIYYQIFMLYALFGHDGLTTKYPALKAELARYFPPPAPAMVGWYDTHASLG